MNQINERWEKLCERRDFPDERTWEITNHKSQITNKSQYPEPK
jgi:hypothetical protein